MTLRARMTGALLAAVLGPVSIGGILIGASVNAANHSRERDRLASAAATVSAAVRSTCGELAAAADSAASIARSSLDPDGSALAAPSAQSVLARIIAAQAVGPFADANAAKIADRSGRTVASTANVPDQPWVMCQSAPTSGGGYVALAAVAQVHDSDGGLAGYVYAARRLDAAFAGALSRTAGVGVTITNADRQSSESETAARWEASAAEDLGGSRTGSTHGRFVTRVDPAAGQPLQLAISGPSTPARIVYAVVATAILICALAVLAAASVLMRIATRPLNEVTEAAGRVVRGELDTRMPIRHNDEVGQLGAAFNRMTREMQSYASALAASRDHLRGGLGLVGDTLASTHDLARILDVILASAITATSAQAGVVMLADPSDDQLRLECSQGFDEYAAAMLAPLVVRFGTGLLGAVAADGSARHGRRSAIVKPAVGEPPCDTFLAVPMRVAPSVGDQTGIRGVVALYDRLGGADFDESDRQALQVFAGQAAIAVDNVRQHDEAKRLSHTDPLTGLYNYRHLKDLLRREAHRAARFGHSLTVLVMDLDRFKEVNDTYGHAAGDAILVEFARRVGVEIRGVDLAFRYGGEEFVLLLPETDALGGVTVAQRLGSAVRDTPVTAPGGHASEIDGAVDVRITVSIGVAVYPDHGTSGDKVLEAADDALYAAKAAGRDTFRLAEPPRREEPDRLPLATPATLTAADVRGEVNREVGPLLAPRDVTPDQRTAKNNRPWRARRSRSGASATPPPPRQARGR